MEPRVLLEHLAVLAELDQQALQALLVRKAGTAVQGNLGRMVLLDWKVYQVLLAVLGTAVVPGLRANLCQDPLVHQDHPDLQGIQRKLTSSRSYMRLTHRLS
jgi:hypothetical protein